MSPLSYILASLAHYRRVQLAVAAGVAVATAVITGALLVGDSVRGSLRELTLERLGRIETVLVAAQPFRVSLGKELAERAAQQSLTLKTAPLVLTRGTLKTTDRVSPRLATGATVVGCSEAFWKFENDREKPVLGSRELALTQSLADELGATVGDRLLLRMPSSSSLPGDSTLAEKEDTIVSRRLTVAAILPGEGLARFSLQPSQRQPRTVFLPLTEIQSLLDWDGQANALAVAQPEQATLPADMFWQRLSALSLQPTLADLGLQLLPITLGDDPKPHALQLTSRTMVLPDHAVEVVGTLTNTQQAQPIVTYLANTLEIDDRKIPYSTVTGVQSDTSLGPLLDETGNPIVVGDDEIVLNSWAADDLKASLGDEVIVRYYEPETTHGTLREARPLRLRLKAIVPLVDAQARPTRAADPDLTPELPGVTDQRSISDWDLPFKLVEKIRPQDEDYWDDYRTTPKAFVSLRQAKQLWHTRWGTVSALRFPASAHEPLSRELVARLDPGELGMRWLPVRRQGLQASRGTTAFAGLFLGFSFFLMASAMLLVSLLFRLGIESRAAEIGLLSAVGVSANQLRRLWLGEATVVAVVGAGTGALAGVVYAGLMIYGLNTLGVAATVEPFLSLHFTWTSFLLGFAIGVAVAMATTAWTLRKTVRLSARQLLTGDCQEPAEKLGVARAKLRWVPVALVLGALLLTFFAKNLTGETQAGGFFGAGALVLTALVWRTKQRLRETSQRVPSAMSLAGLSVRNARRSPSRTILSISLAAVASFLIVALSAFRLTPSEQGTGGYDLFATVDQPLLYDLDSESGRAALGLGANDNRQLAGMSALSLRVHAGEDASCLNLYQTTQPRVLGIPIDGIAESQFHWAAASEDVSQPWQLLDRDIAGAAGQAIVPIVLDKNTAIYSLHLGGVGSQMTIRDAADRVITLQVVGLLAGSVLQGDVLMSEANFLRLYPDTTGHRLMLLQTGELPASELATLLQSRLEDFGFQATDTRKRLADFMAVQNIYLSTFQTLGALGLLLGTVGLAVAQLRSVFERRSELALLRSVGFAPSRLARMVLSENLVLLLGGLGIGCLAALIAVLPHWWWGEADTPWGALALMLLGVAVAGTLAGGLAIRTAVRAPLVASLRGE